MIKLSAEVIETLQPFACSNLVITKDWNLSGGNGQIWHRNRSDNSIPPT